ncbi:MAG: hypothetical protein AB7G54_00430 [Methyloceanibacter sp.]
MGKRKIRNHPRSWKLDISYNLKDCPDRAWDDRIIGLVGSDYLRFARSGRYSRNWMFEVVEFGFWFPEAEERHIDKIEEDLLRLREDNRGGLRFGWSEGGSAPPAHW